MDLAVDMIEHFCDPFPQTGFPIWVSSRHSIVFPKETSWASICWQQCETQQFESNVDWLPYFWESMRWHPSFHLGLCTESIEDDDFLGLWLPSCIGFGLWNWPLRSCLMFPPSAGPAGGCGSVSVSNQGNWAVTKGPWWFAVYVGDYTTQFYRDIWPGHYEVPYTPIRILTECHVRVLLPLLNFGSGFLTTSE